MALSEVADFGVQELGSAGPPRTVEIVNRGERRSQGFRLFVDGPEQHDFSLGSMRCPSISAGKPCLVEITFEPRGMGARRAILRVTGSARPLAQLVGHGIERPVPVPHVEPSGLDFGESLLGGPPKAAAVSIANRGVGDLLLIGASVAGEADSEFAATLDCPTMRVPPGGVCTVQILFSAGAAGPRTARLELSFSGAAPASIDLAGLGIELITQPEPVPEVSGPPAGALVAGDIESTPPTDSGDDAPAGLIAPVPSAPDAEPLLAATVDPTLLDFGNEPVARTSDAQSVTVKNTGGADLSIGEIIVTGPEADDFVIVTDDCSGSSLAPEGTCRVDVAFSPTSGGQRSAVLELRSSLTDPLTVPLTGRGTRDGRGHLVAAPTTVMFPSSVVGSRSVSTVVLANVGESPLVETVLVSDGEEFAVEGGTCFGDQEAVLAVGGTCDILVAFTPSGAGARLASMIIIAGSGEPLVVTLQGQGVTLA